MAVTVLRVSIRGVLFTMCTRIVWGSVVALSMGRHAVDSNDQVFSLEGFHSVLWRIEWRAKKLSFKIDAKGEWRIAASLGNRSLGIC